MTAERIHVVWKAALKLDTGLELIQNAEVVIDLEPSLGRGLDHAAGVVPLVHLGAEWHQVSNRRW